MDNLNAEQLRFCSKLLDDLHRNITSPFCKPVGVSILNSHYEQTILTIILLRLGCVKHSNLS